MRFFTSLLLIIGLLFGANSALAQSYPDVPAYYKHYDAIEALNKAGIVKGYAHGHFEPEALITRAEATKILVGLTADQSSLSSALDQHLQKSHHYVNFIDIPINHWAAPYIEVAFKNNMVSGYDSGHFYPNNTLSYAEALKLILVALEVNTSMPFTQRDLLYVNRGDWFAPYFEAAARQKLISPNKFYHPQMQMTRGEFTETIHRILYIKNHNLNQFPHTAIQSNEYTITIPALNIIDHQVAMSDPYNADAGLETLRHSPFGHYFAKPGEGQKFVLFGHSSGFAWDSSPYKVVLRQINQLQNGDLIYINYNEQAHVYKVNNQRILPASQINSITRDYGYEELALYTCWPPDSTKDRYIVHTEKITINN